MKQFETRLIKLNKLPKDGYLDIASSSCVYSDIRVHTKVRLNFIDLLISLEYGNISNLKNVKSRHDDYVKIDEFVYEKPNEFIFQETSHRKFLRNIKGISKFRIWASMRSSTDVCLFYYLVNLLRDKEIYLVDASSKISAVMFTDKITDETDIPVCRLKKKDKDEIVNQWDILTKNNADMRIIKRRRLVECSYESGYDFVLSHFSGTIMKKRILVGDTLCDKKNIYSWQQIEAIVNKMIHDKVFKIVKMEIKDEHYGMYDCYISLNDQYDIISK